MKRFTLILLCLLSVTFVDAQRLGDDNWDRNGRNNCQFRINRAPSLSAQLQVGTPVGEFARELDRTTVGFSGAFLANQGRSPLEWGVQFAWAGIGREHQDVTWDLGMDDQNNAIIQDGRLRVRGNMYKIVRGWGCESNQEIVFVSFVRACEDDVASEAGLGKLAASSAVSHGPSLCRRKTTPLLCIGLQTDVNHC